MNAMHFRQINRLNMHLPLRVTRRIDQLETEFTMRQLHLLGTPESLEAEYTVTENICSGGCYFFLVQAPPWGRG